MQLHVNVKLEAQLNKNDFDESQLVEIKVPLDLPYQTEWKEFERFDGEMEINGILYKYVKRKVVDGHLVLLCLPNEKKIQLQTARDNFFKLVNDLQNNTPGNSIVIKNPITEFWQEENNWSLAGLILLKQQYPVVNSRIFSTVYHNTPEQPPEA